MWMANFIVDFVEELNYNNTGVGDTAQTIVCDSGVVGNARPCQGGSYY